MTACHEAVAAGLMDSHPFPDFVPGDMSEANYAHIDLHKHVVDGIVLKAADGRPMHRESDLIDVWFDSGSMPYAQWHYPFENKDRVDGPDGGLAFPADFIAEGVDQTRGWFYTLHAISTMVFRSGGLPHGGVQRVGVGQGGSEDVQAPGECSGPF